MRKIRPLLLGLALVFALAATGAAAASSTNATGTYTYTDSYFESFRVAGGNVIIDLVATVEYTGTLTGTSEVRGTIVVHEDGSANFRDVEVFTGTVDGVPGTIVFRVAGSNDSALNVRTTSTIVSATGGLAGLHGTLQLGGSVRFPEGPYGVYHGTIR